jgi:hypothetical protein
MASPNPFETFACTNFRGSGLETLVNISKRWGLGKYVKQPLPSGTACCRVCSLLMGSQDNQQLFVRKVESWVPLLAFKVSRICQPVSVQNCLTQQLLSSIPVLIVIGIPLC